MSTRPTLAESLAIIMPHLPTALFPPNAMVDIHALASVLPAIPRAGFECRLGGQVTPADFQQGISHEGAEPAILLAHLEAPPYPSDQLLNPVWRRLHDFAVRWTDPTSPIHTGVEQVWLEFDMDGAASLLRVPSVFIALQSDPPSPHACFDSIAATWDAFLDVAMGIALRRNLQRCLTACPQGAMIRHLGLMLSRQTQAVRTTVQWLPHDAVVSYLQQVGWNGPVNEIQALLLKLFSCVDRIRLCLDVSETVHPQVGLECFFEQQPSDEPRWQGLLNALVDEGACTRQKAEALLAWPGSSTPATCAVLWPEHLLAQALLQPPDCFGVFERCLSHLKIIYHPQRPLAVKGYLGFMHNWKRPAVISAAAVTVQGSVALPQTANSGQLPNAPDGDDLAASIAAAVTFLLASRTQGGWWRDYFDGVGVSDEWVTAYVGAVLAAVPHPRAHQAAYLAWHLLQQRRHAHDGWGYSSQSPADADSTAWALRLAQSVEASRPSRAQEAALFLTRHVRADGGVSTYADEQSARRFLGHPPPPSTEGWRHTHACVTAAVAALDDLGERPRRFLQEAQQPDGRWVGYWWSDDEYTTALAAEALARTACAEYVPCVHAAVHWALQRFGLQGAIRSEAYGADSPFATAWCIRLLLLAKNRQRVREPLICALRWLVGQQRPDGSWESSAYLRTPPPEIIHPEPHHPSILSLDRYQNFTTATVLMALEHARRWWQGSPVLVATARENTGHDRSNADAARRGFPQNRCCAEAGIQS